MHRPALAAVIAALATVLLAAPAEALNTRSFVSATSGSDSANGQRPTPCRTFAVAITKTSAGGEIDVLDPGGYGPLTITKAISIINDGVGTAALIPPANGTGITINAGAGDAISLRGLTIDGQGNTGTNGIVFNSGASLTLRDSVVRRNTDYGVRFQPAIVATFTTSKSVFESNNIGILLYPSGVGDTKAVLNHVELNNNGYGLQAFVDGKDSGKLAVSVSDSMAANNSNTAFYANGNILQNTFTLMRSTVANNNHGLDASGATVVVRIGESMLTDNVYGWVGYNGGQVLSYGTNQVDGNTNADSITSKIPLD